MYFALEKYYDNIGDYEKIFHIFYKNHPRLKKLYGGFKDEVQSITRSGGSGSKLCGDQIIRALVEVS